MNEKLKTAIMGGIYGGLGLTVAWMAYLPIKIIASLAPVITKDTLLISLLLSFFGGLWIITNIATPLLVLGVNTILEATHGKV